MTKKIGILVGSLRKDSYNKKVAEKVKTLFPDAYEVNFIDVDLPLYNEDLDADGPADVYADFRKAIDESDAFVFVTPEYNRSVPATLKNAIDVGSRPFGAGYWDKKPAGVISVSPGATGGMASNHALRQTFVFVDLQPMQQPEAYLSNIGNYIDDQGNFADATVEILQKFVDAFVEHVDRVSQ